jgi:hypothetical protein
MKKDYLKNVNDLSDRIKNETPKIPIQQVKAVKVKVSEDNGHLSIWIPKDLLKRVKTLAIQEDIPIKEIGAKALELYLSTRPKS